MSIVFFCALPRWSVIAAFAPSAAAAVEVLEAAEVLASSSSLLLPARSLSYLPKCYKYTEREGLCQSVTNIQKGKGGAYVMS